MSDLIRAIRMTPPPRPYSEDAPIIRYPDARGLLESKIESQQRAVERQIARSSRAARQHDYNVPVQPIRLSTPQNFIINMPVN